MTPGLINSLRFNFHPKRCVGCGRCITTCLDAHDALIGSIPPPRVMYRRENARGGQVRIEHYTVACMHCDDAPCATVCPKRCFHKEGRFILLEPKDCIGCRACAGVCPYQAIRFQNRKAFKCNGCVERVRRGEDPLCAAACPHKAITLDDRNEVLQNGHEWLKKSIQQTCKGEST